MIRRNHGVALVTALAILVVVALVVLGVFFTTRIQLFVTRNDATSTQANYVAQAGLQEYKGALFQYYRWLEQTGVTMPNPARTACFNRLSYGIEFDRVLSNIQNGTLQYVWDPSTNVLSTYDSSSGAYTPATFTGTVTDAYGNAVVGSYSVTFYRDPNNNNIYSITSKGSSHGAVSTARASFTIQNSGVLEQAIFSGVGQSNKYLNGGGTIHGGVYIVGGDPNASVFDSNGNFSLLNGYDLANTGSYGSVNGVQLAQYVTSGNRTVSNLCASLQVESGQVNIGSNAVTLGTPSNKLLGVNVSAGTQDINSGGTIPPCGQNGGVCSDSIGPFTIQDPPAFPTLDGPPDSKLCSQSTWRACIHYDANNKGIMATDGNVTLPSGMTADAASFHDQCAVPLESTDLVLDGTTTIDCVYEDPTTNKKYGFKYDGTKTPAELDVYGSVDLQGYNVTFAKDTVYKTQPDSGTASMSNASFVVEDNGQCSTSSACGNVTLNGDLLPAASSTDPATQFPNNVLGLIAENNLVQNSSYVMAPLYAGATFRTGKSKVLVGSVISNNFCTTTAGSGSTCNAGQKADIVYVNTANNKPMLLKQISPKAGIPTFKVDTYELR